MQAKLKTMEDVVSQVQALVKKEQLRAAAADTIAAAEGLVSTNAEALLERIVAHFQHLFSVQRLEGVLPAMNQVHRTTHCAEIL